MRAFVSAIKRGGPDVDLEAFSIVTTLPNDLTRSVNPERSPSLLLSEEAAQAWLTGSASEALATITTTDPERLRIVQAGFDKEDLGTGASAEDG